MDCFAGVIWVITAFTELWIVLQVSFGRQQRSGSLMVDGELVGRAKSRGGTRSINVNAPYFVGGLSEGAKKAALGNVGVSSAPFAVGAGDCSAALPESTVKNGQQAKWESEINFLIEENSKPQDLIVYTDGSVTKDQSG